MATHTLRNVPWPDGTTINVYPRVGRLPLPLSAPPGTAAVDTATVSGNQAALSGLVKGSRYWAIGQDNAAVWRWVAFRVPPTLDGDEAGLWDRVAELEAQAQTSDAVVGAGAYSPFDYDGIGDGVTDDTAAIQAAHDAAKGWAYWNKRRAVLSLGGGRWKTTGQLTIDSHFVIVDGGGAVIDASGVPIFTVALYVTADPDRVEGEKSWNNSAESIRDFELVGPGGASGTQGIKFERPTGLSGGIGPARLSLRNVVVHDFSGGITYGNNTWGINHVDCAIYNCEYGITFPYGGSNAGERLSYRGCNIFSCRVMVTNSSSGCDMYFDQCSLDYPDYVPRSLNTHGTPGTVNPRRCFINANTGRVYLNQCHIEGNHDDDYWFRVGADKADWPYDAVPELKIASSEILVSGNKNNYELGYISAVSGSGGMTFRDCRIRQQGNYNLGTLVAGDSLARASGISWEDYVAAWQPPICRALGRLDGTFENAWAASQWAFTSSSSAGDYPTIATDQAKRGTHSMKFAVGTNGHASKAYANIPVSPGQVVFISFWNMIQGVFGSDNWFQVSVNFDTSGTFAYSTPTVYGGGPTYWQTTAWALRKIQPVVVPRSATVLQILFVTGGGSWVTSAAAWVDDLVVNVLS